MVNDSRLVSTTVGLFFIQEAIGDADHMLDPGA